MLFDALTPQSLDPIMASFARFAADKRPEKTNLAVGMYYDEDGRIPVLDVVQRAERDTTVASWGYLLPTGMPALRDGAKRLVFGDALVEREGARIVTVQSLGGTGALRMGADVIQRVAPGSTVALSDPTWGNHPSIFAGAGLPLTTYPYFDPATGGVDWPGMRAAIAAMPPGTVVLLHACCHNPTGADLDAAQWQDLVGLMVERRLVPFLDMAYAGFAEGLEQDSAPARIIASARIPSFVASSFSKSFGLYGERVGALSIVAADAGQAKLVEEQMAVAIRANYSTPPTHGAMLVTRVLSDPALRAQWMAELEGMRQRIRRMREGLVRRLSGSNTQDWSRLVRQKGLFSFSGLSAGQMDRLRDEFGIYGVSDGRLCMAALTEASLDRVADGIRKVSVV